MKETWKIPVVWEMHGIVEIPKEKFPILAKAMFYVSTGAEPLPEGECTEGSFHLDHEGESIGLIREKYNNGEIDVIPPDYTRHFELEFITYKGEEKTFVVDAKNFERALVALYDEYGEDDPKVLYAAEDGEVLIRRKEPEKKILF